MKTILYQTSTHDPWLNLAREEYLLENLPTDHAIFYLWQNQNTVVIGKNQNPWKECQTKLLENENVFLARRTSGGGAVFHDLGNLNFTFIVPRSIYDLTRQLSVILYALETLGIQAEFKGRNDIVIGDRKFSGNAFCYRADHALHHGTILVSADLQKMTRYLQVSPEKILSKGIESVRSRVMNLQECSSGLTIPAISQALIASFEKLYGKCTAQYDGDKHLDANTLQVLYQKHSSWDWQFGYAPDFDVTLETRFAWGGIEIGLGLENAQITKCHIYSDAMDEAFIAVLPNILRGCKFSGKILAEAIEKYFWSNEQQQSQAKEIAGWLEKKDF